MQFIKNILIFIIFMKSLCSYQSLVRSSTFLGRTSSHEKFLSFATISSSFTSSSEEKIEELRKFVDSSSFLLSITGAGISTDSGIPDYRGPNGSYKKGHKPITHSEFIHQEESRQRYWARSMIGFSRLLLANPNLAHFSLVELEKRGKLRNIITQNVDRLHQKAGSKSVVDLHGRIDEAICLSCSATVSRHDIQHELIDRNKDYWDLVTERIGIINEQEGRDKDDKVRADGDMDLGNIDYSRFKCPCCSVCGGILKPNVVFFGDNVPTEKVQSIYKQVCCLSFAFISIIIALICRWINVTVYL
jgi:NAD-dependent deacetylase sirtuin 4